MESTPLIEKSDIHKAYENRINKIKEEERKQKENDRRKKKSLDKQLNQSFEDNIYNGLVSTINRRIEYNEIKDTNRITISGIRRLHDGYYGGIKCDKISKNIIDRLQKKFKDINVTKIWFKLGPTESALWHIINCFVCCIPECILQYKQGSMYSIKCTLEFTVNFDNVDAINDN